MAKVGEFMFRSLLLILLSASAFADGDLIGKWELIKDDVHFNWIFRDDGTCDAYENGKLSLEDKSCRYQLSGDKFSLTIKVDGKTMTQSGTIEIDGDFMSMKGNRSGTIWRRVGNP